MEAGEHEERASLILVRMNENMSVPHRNVVCLNKLYFSQSTKNNRTTLACHGVTLRGLRKGDGVGGQDQILLRRDQHLVS